MKKLYLLSGTLLLGIFASINAMESRPEIYGIIDSLVPEYEPFGASWRLASKVDWPAVFVNLDLMKDTIAVNEYRSLNNETLLCRAVWGLNFLAAKTLLEKYKANPNLLCGKAKNTALYLAVIKRDVLMVKLLLMHGANPNIKNSL